MKQEDRQLCITGILGIVIIISLVIVVMRQPLGATQRFSNPQSFVVSQQEPLAASRPLDVGEAKVPCAAMQGFCYNAEKDEFCEYAPGGECQSACECRLQ